MKTKYCTVTVIQKQTDSTTPHIYLFDEPCITILGLQLKVFKNISSTLFYRSVSLSLCGTVTTTTLENVLYTLIVNTFKF